jgi:hypothetical protein
MTSDADSVADAVRDGLSPVYAVHGTEAAAIASRCGRDVDDVGAMRVEGSRRVLH